MHAKFQHPMLKTTPKKAEKLIFSIFGCQKFQNLKILLKKKFRAKKINYIRLIYGVDGCFMQKKFKIGGHTKTLCGFLGLCRRISKKWIFSKKFFSIHFLSSFWQFFIFKVFFSDQKSIDELICFEVLLCAGITLDYMNGKNS